MWQVCQRHDILFIADEFFSDRIVAESLGLILRPIGHLNVMSPPLVITETQVDFIAETLETAIRRATDELEREGHRIA